MRNTESERFRPLKTGLNFWRRKTLCEIMRDFYHVRIAEQPGAEQVHDTVGVCIFSLPVPQRHIDGAPFLYGKADAGEPRPVRVA